MKRQAIFSAVLFGSLCSWIAGCVSEQPTADSSLDEAAGVDLVTAAALQAWTKRAPMPTARSNYATVAFKNSAGKTTIYAIGGMTGLTVLNVVEAYDPVANTWTRKAPMPARRFDTNGATAVGNKIYVVGGWKRWDDASPSGGFWEYTPATNTWRTLPWVCCGSGTSGVIGGKIYVYWSNDGAETQRLSRYDPATSTWVELAPSLYPHDGAWGTVFGGKFYVLGEETMEAYDPATDTWSPKTFMNAGLLAMNGRLYAFNNDPYSPYPQGVLIYNPANDTWSPWIPMPSGGFGPMAAVTLSGKSFAYGNGVGTFLKFDPSVANKPPTAIANGPYAGTVGQSVQFSAQGSFDPEGAWNGTWTFGDGTSYTGTFGNFASQNPTHTYSAAGTYPVTFTVTDWNGVTATASTTASIQ